MWPCRKNGKIDVIPIPKQLAVDDKTEHLISTRRHVGPALDARIVVKHKGDIANASFPKN